MTPTGILAWPAGAIAVLLAGSGLGSGAAVLPNDLVAEGRAGVVVSAEPHATRVGLQVLADGGNAVDAAVAVALTLAVTHPQAGNLGGGGFLRLELEGDSEEIDRVMTFLKDQGVAVAEIEG